MTFLPVTVYALACDSRGCGVTYEFRSPEDDELYEMHLTAPRVSRAVALTVGDDGWLISDRHLCSEHARVAADHAVHRLEIEVTHEPLFDDGGSR